MVFLLLAWDQADQAVCGTLLCDRQVWESSAAAAREPNRDRLQPLGARGVSDSTRPSWLPDAIGEGVVCQAKCHGWRHNGRQMAIQISAAAHTNCGSDCAVACTL